MERANYREYQQVLNISVKPKSVRMASSKRISKPAKKEASAPVKRRTKTGCLTCRKRKKKCDEDKVNGKCQGCTRNFLECCWPDSAASSDSCDSSPEPVVLPKSFMLPQIITASPSTSHFIDVRKDAKSTKCSISSLIEPVKIEPKTEIKTEQPAVVNPYPSPSQSPVADIKQEVADISYIALPPLLNLSYKSKDSNIRGIKQEFKEFKEFKQEFKQEVQIKKEEEVIGAAPSTPPTSLQAKFVITSFNVNNDLCQI